MSGATNSDIFFSGPAAGSSSAGSVSPTTVNLSPAAPTAQVTVTVNPGSFAGAINFSCLDTDTNSAIPSWLTCTFNPTSLNPATSTTDTLTFTRAATPTASVVSGPTSNITPAYSRRMAFSSALCAFGLMAMAIFALGRGQKLGSGLMARGLLVLTLMLALGLGLVSCGGTTSSSGSGGSGGSGGGGGGSTVTIHVAVMAQSGGAAAVNLGTVTVNAQ